MLEATPVGGGCISRAMRLRCATGESFFLKRGPRTPVGLFGAESTSLERIAATGTLRVPEVIAVADVDAPGGEPDAGLDSGWLLLEWLEPGVPDRATWDRLGAGLASLHRTGDAAFGWPTDNFIGTLPQANAPTSSWAEFWRERRLRPQLELALAGGAFAVPEVARFDALFAALDQLLAPAREDGPSLLHGDLWSGNLHVLTDGEPALVDPASYFGHREVDLAMTQLFGGFDARFLHAYREAWPLATGYERERRPLYQFYYLLVHVNLFGGSYRRATLEALADLGF